MNDPIQDKPQDLSMKSSRKVKHIPPPLDLNARTLVVSDEANPPLPKSPSELPRECLPLRKRALVEVRKDLVCKSPKSSAFFNPSSPLRLPVHPPSSNSSLTPCSANSSSTFTQFPLPPPPLIPPSSVAVAAAAAAAAAISSYPKSPYLTHVNGFPTPPTELHSPYPWPPGPLFSPFSTFSSSALLSPAPSYPSSTNSSREELPPLGAPPGSGSNTTSSYGESDSKRRFLSAAATTGFASAGTPSVLPAADSSSPVPSSPLLSPRNWSHTWPTPIWQCFVGGTLVKFLIPNIETPWQTVEDLNWKDRLALKVDSKNSYQYAPDGLTIVKMDVINREISSRTNNNNNTTSNTGSSSSSGGGGGGSKSNDIKTSESSGENVTLLRLRMAPHRGDNSPEILVECSLDHPFFVKEKGWSSGHARFSIEKYGIPCQELSVGDVCLPPNHPEAVRTPDLCDRFRRFEFSAEDIPSSPLHPLHHQLFVNAAANRSRTSANTANCSSNNNSSSSGGNNSNSGGGGPLATSVSSGSGSKLSPPMSPAKHLGSKKEKDSGGEKPKRPMNGFMLFAKKYRLELIQQHPGKDNRAISVLLGEAWKSLPQADRESYSSRAKVLADEQKKIYPDCWKRKRTLTSNGGGVTPSSHPGTPTLHHSPQVFFPPSMNNHVVKLESQDQKLPFS